MAVNIKIVVLRITKPCYLIGRYQNFKGILCMFVYLMMLSMSRLSSRMTVE
jgi:hypothetical protein